MTRGGRVISGLDLLEAAIKQVTIPKAPPRLSRDGAGVGLSFLDTALRQNHIRRITERIRCVEVGVGNRGLEVDISLSLLERGQWEASTRFQELRLRARSAETPQPSTEGISTPREHALVAWVPIARLPRQETFPVTVTDSTGNSVPLLTQFETSRLLASGIYRLMRAIMRSPGGNFEEDEVRTFNAFLGEGHRARWLMQSALLTLLTERSKPLGTGERAPRDEPEDRVRSECRASACKVVGLLRGVPELDQLIGVAISDQLVVVGLDPRCDEHLLSFPAPLIPRSEKSPFTETYRVKYETTVPASIRAYHLVFESEPGVAIRGMILSSEADCRMTETLADDFNYLAARVDKTDAYSRSELRASLSRLSDLMRRRRWELVSANDRLPHSTASPEDDKASLRMNSESIPHIAALESYADDAKSKDYSVQPDPEELKSLAGNLYGASDELRSSELGRDLTCENDPAGSVAHTYWRRTPSKRITSSRIRLTATMALVDSAESRPSIVRNYALAVLIVAAAVVWAVTGNPLDSDIRIDGGTADAAAAILLLVPGLLYYRLDLPDPRSISGRVRRWPRVVALASLAAMLALSTLILSGIGSTTAQILTAVCLAVPASGFVALLIRDHHRGNEDAAPLVSAPAWVSHSRVRDVQSRRKRTKKTYDLTLVADPSFLPSGKK